MDHTIFDTLDYEHTTSSLELACLAICSCKAVSVCSTDNHLLVLESTG